MNTKQMEKEAREEARLEKEIDFVVKATNEMTKLFVFPIVNILIKAKGHFDREEMGTGLAETINSLENYLKII